MSRKGSPASAQRPASSATHPTESVADVASTAPGEAPARAPVPASSQTDRDEASSAVTSITRSAPAGAEVVGHGVAHDPEADHRDVGHGGSSGESVGDGWSVPHRHGGRSGA